MKYILFALLIYIAYQFIFRLVVPVYRATRQFKQGFQEMHSRMEEQMRQQQQTAPSTPPPAREKAGDYIDFEEIK